MAGAKYMVVGKPEHLSDGDSTSRLAPTINTMIDHLAELRAKAEDLGGFESLARISKLEVDLHSLQTRVIEHTEANLAFVDAKVRDLEEQVGKRAEARLVRRLWHLALVWLGVQIAYSIARVFLALKGHG